MVKFRTIVESTAGACSTMPEDEAFFNNFDLERICIDKVFFVVYDADYCMVNHPFDTKTRDEYINYVKRSFVKRRRFEEVLRREEGEISSYELHLRGGRTMFCHVNVIRYLQHLTGVKPSQKLVLHDNNFMPPNEFFQVKDYIKALDDVRAHMERTYGLMCKQLWGVSLTNIKSSLVQVEIPFEVSPANCDEVYNKLISKGVTHISRYDNQSGTIYFQDKIGERQIKLAPGLTTRLVDGDYNDYVFINNINSGFIESKIQMKIYQKSWGLVRVEFTLSCGTELKNIFEPEDSRPVDQSLIEWVHYQLRKSFLSEGVLTPYNLTFESIIKALSKAMKISEDVLARIRTQNTFESSGKNNVMRKKLLKLGIIERVKDDTGSVSRGFYPYAAWIKDFVRSVEPSGKELCLPGLLEKVCI